ncbi:MAG: PTS sugar transporter subunit IIB, partial [Metamycoplasmataceae bacterium]
MKVLLACSAGMSTSMLEESMKKYAKSIGQELDVLALPSNEAKAKIKYYDVVLLG